MLMNNAIVTQISQRNHVKPKRHIGTMKLPGLHPRRDEEHELKTRDDCLE